MILKVRKFTKSKRGSALVEYALLVAGVALIAAGAVSILGHKTSDLVGSVAAVLPGAHADDNGPLVSGKLIETTAPGGATTGIAIDFAGIASSGINTSRLGDNLGAGSAIEDLILEVE